MASWLVQKKISRIIAELRLLVNVPLVNGAHRRSDGEAADELPEFIGQAAQLGRVVPHLARIV